MTGEPTHDRGPTDPERPLRERLRAAARDRDGETGDLLAAAADRLEDRSDRVAELQTELEETNEGMVALTLELEEAERRYRSLFENAVEGIYKTTPDGRRYVMANGSMADLLGYDSPEALQRAVTDVGEDVFVDRERYREYKRALREGESVENFEYRVRRADGEVRWVSDNARPLYDDGDPAGFRGGVIDVTEVKEYERRLETKNQELEALNRVVRHDINNDIQVIRGFAEHLRGSVQEDHRRAVEKIIAASDHIVELTQDAREFIEALAGREEPQLEPTPLDELLVYELDRQREAHEEATFEVTTDLPSVTVTANEMLSSVFRNLLTNAVQHHDRAAPTVEVACSVGPETVRVEIADDGPGVPDDRKDEIFGKGEQSMDSEGTGIGLYLVSELVSNYGGDIWVEDRAGDQRGAAFVVELPRAESNER